MSLPFSIDALASFVALAEELHFTRAAARLHVAQPAVTKRIKQVESALDLPLFARTRRSVRLTPEGEALLEPAREVLRAAEALLHASGRLQSGDAGRIRIGFTPSAPHHVLPAIMRAFRAAHPDVVCRLTETGSEDQVRRLLTGDLDVGILRPPHPVPGELVCKTFLEEPYVVVVPRQHRLAGQGAVPLRALHGESLILIARKVVATIFQQIVDACAKEQVVPRSVEEASHIHAVGALVAAGAGISILPRSAARLGLQDVVCRPLRGSTLRTVMAVARRRQQPSPLAVAFFKQVKPGVNR